MQVVSYGIKDKHYGNLDIKLMLQSEYENKRAEKGIDIRLNHDKEKVDENDDEVRKRSIKIKGDVKATLASKPVKYLLKDLQKYLSIRYDMVRYRLTMKYDGTDPEKFPSAKKDKRIYQNKIVDATVNDQR